jgi:hypothetical protein
MSGQPAETRRVFRFATAPGWATAFLFLMCIGVGFFISGPLVFLVSRRARGYLPLTQASNRRLGRMLPVSAAVLAAGAVICVASGLLGTSRDPLANLAALLLFSLGLLLVLFGFTGLQIGLQTLRPLFGPTGKVLRAQPGQPETSIELRNVHPAFVAAVQQMDAARMAQGPRSN